MRPRRVLSLSLASLLAALAPAAAGAAADSKTLYFTAEDAGHSPVFSVPVAGGAVTKVLGATGTFGDLSVSRDGRTLIATHATLTRPVAVDVVGERRAPAGRAARVGHEDHVPRAREYLGVPAVGPAVGPRALGPAVDEHEQRVLPRRVESGRSHDPRLDALARGSAVAHALAGAQGEAGEEGVVYAGHAREARSVRGEAHQLSKAFEDVMKGTDFAESLPYLEKGRSAAAGASYGGYLINWIAGQTARFKALVSHDGVFDLVSMYGATEELWFPEWEFGGPYWSNPEGYARHNPRDFVKRFKTPTLVVHGEKDYRVPLEQGLAMFTALRRQDVPARLLLFPDENHWVLKPANSVRWYAEVLGWLDRWTKP